jgi:hypothetical protein
MKPYAWHTSRSEPITYGGILRKLCHVFQSLAAALSGVSE